MQIAHGSGAMQKLHCCSAKWTPPETDRSGVSLAHRNDTMRRRSSGAPTEPPKHAALKDLQDATGRAARQRRRRSP